MCVCEINLNDLDLIEEKKIKHFFLHTLLLIIGDLYICLNGENVIEKKKKRYILSITNDIYWNRKNNWYYMWLSLWNVISGKIKRRPSTTVNENGKLIIETIFFLTCTCTCTCVVGICFFFAFPQQQQHSIDHNDYD